MEAVQSKTVPLAPNRSASTGGPSLGQHLGRLRHCGGLPFQSCLHKVPVRLGNALVSQSFGQLFVGSHPHVCQPRPQTFRRCRLFVRFAECLPQVSHQDPRVCEDALSEIVKFLHHDCDRILRISLQDVDLFACLVLDDSSRVFQSGAIILCQHWYFWVRPPMRDARDFNIRFRLQGFARGFVVDQVETSLEGIPGQFAGKFVQVLSHFRPSVQSLHDEIGENRGESL
mmetsp:Transcript_23137/g.49283  ORF Transcript_23137/g.49283 Transcript_23137/m.49283 type:complete len:228 (-) Transcript_23137:160-843(-)